MSQNSEENQRKDTPSKENNQGLEDMKQAAGQFAQGAKKYFDSAVKPAATEAVKAAQSAVQEAGNKDADLQSKVLTLSPVILVIASIVQIIATLFFARLSAGIGLLQYHLYFFAEPYPDVFGGLLFIVLAAVVLAFSIFELRQQAVVRANWFAPTYTAVLFILGVYGFIYFLAGSHVSGSLGPIVHAGGALLTAFICGIVYIVLGVFRAMKLMKSK